MSNWITVGPVCLRVGGKHLAPWGYERLKIGGLSIWSHTNGGDLILASYHPRGCTTWHWSLSLIRGQRELKHIYSRASRRIGQWHDYLKLPFGYQLCLSRQDYHRKALAAGSGTAKTAQQAECEASQSGGAAVTPAQSQPSSRSSA